MSLRQVLTIFNAERQLGDDDTALLNTLRKMSGAELELLGGSLAPQAKPKPRKKRETSRPMRRRCNNRFPGRRQVSLILAKGRSAVSAHIPKTTKTTGSHRRTITSSSHRRKQQRRETSDVVD